MFPASPALPEKNVKNVKYPIRYRTLLGDFIMDRSEFELIVHPNGVGGYKKRTIDNLVSYSVKKLKERILVEQEISCHSTTKLSITNQLIKVKNLK